MLKIINPIDALLRLACRVAHRRWNPPDRIPDGVPGIRDVRHACACYSPRSRPEVLAERAIGCRGDGHYLCRECCWLVAEHDETEGSDPHAR